MRKKLISLFFTPIIAVPFIELTSCRENPTWTVMVYLCGSDLETNPLNGGWASSALDKILLSNFGSNVHVVVETGGATSWREHGIANNKLQRYQVINHRMVLKENLATNEMSTDNALSNFIDYGVNNFHADRYAFIF
jgi:hypothetical protein